MEQLERLTGRLDNIEAVEPILSALRTISLGSRLQAMNRQRAVDRYRQQLLPVLGQVVQQLPRAPSAPAPETQDGSHTVLLVIGSERGLCGAFTEVVAAYAAEVATRYMADGKEVRLMALGKQTQRALSKRKRLPVWAGSLSLTSLPRFELASQLTLQWLQEYEDRALDAVEVAYNAPRGVASYEPRLHRLVPPDVPKAIAQAVEWPPIVETDPLGLYTRMVVLWLSATLYSILLESAVAEHTARYQLLDGAVQNTERLIDELTLFLQMARQEAITMEMEDLAVGAGLLGQATD
jgi:F-type H+-transporting ATPase subunit gamma